MLGNCVDTSNGKNDTRGFGCDYYFKLGNCGEYDSSEFIANSMCCACNGGTIGNYRESA